MLAVLESPIKLRVPIELVPKAQKELNYEDKKVTYDWLKWVKVLKQDNDYLTKIGQPNCPKRHWYFNRNSREDLINKINDLDKQRFKSLLFQDEKGYWTYSGFVTRLFGSNAIIKREYEVPEFSPIPWDHEPKITPRYYQTDTVNLLVPEDYSRTHGAVEIGTGLGKTFIMALMLRRMGLPAIIVVPTLSIAEQMLKDMTYWFGRGNVGQFFDGKKEPNKRFVVAVAKSLMNVEDVSIFQDKKIVITDEGHTLPAESLAKIVLDLLGFIPYRFSFSATMLRSDGLGLLLEGIIGDIVYEMTVEQGVKEGFLSKPIFYQWKIESKSNFNKDDPIEMNRQHLHYNPLVASHAVRLAKYAVNKGKRVLIMIDEVEQFFYLKNAGILDLNIRFAFGGNLTKEQKAFIPKELQKADNLKLVQEFDSGAYPVLIGTSAIGMGTDIKSVNCIIDLVGLTSEVRVKQNVGRGTRLFEGKTDCIYNDYCVYNIEKLAKHAKARRKIFDSIYGKTQIMEAK